MLDLLKLSPSLLVHRLQIRYLSAIGFFKLVKMKSIVVSGGEKKSFKINSSCFVGLCKEIHRKPSCMIILCRKSILQIHSRRFLCVELQLQIISVFQPAQRVTSVELNSSTQRWFMRRVLGRKTSMRQHSVSDHNSSFPSVEGLRGDLTDIKSHFFLQPKWMPGSDTHGCGWCAAATARLICKSFYRRAVQFVAVVWSPESATLLSCFPECFFMMIFSFHFFPYHHHQVLKEWNVFSKTDTKSLVSNKHKAGLRSNKTIKEEWSAFEILSVCFCWCVCVCKGAGEKKHLPVLWWLGQKH